MKIWKCAALFLCSAFSFTIYAASFNCDKARTEVDMQSVNIGLSMMPM